MEQNLIVNEKQTIREALAKINENAKGVIFVNDSAGILKGMVTDGDIRRALLNGLTLDIPVGNIKNENFVYAYEDEKSSEILKKFNCKIKIIPIVNHAFQMVDYSEYKKDMRLPIAQPQLDGNELDYLLEAFLSTWISSTGKYVERFEQDFSAFCNVSHGVATSNGTTALHLALTVLGIGKGDEVIVPDITFAATINAVLYTGATPVIVDIEPDSWCIDPAEIEKAITKRTRAIIPVHIYGQPCDMGRIMEIAREHNLYVVEDCAEAHGAMYRGKKVGEFGEIGCFSFFGNKVITTGEGGMCVTNDAELDRKMRLYRDHGMSRQRRYYHDVVGYNYRMTNLQAAIGVAQLERIDETLKWRAKLEETYRDRLSGMPGIKLQRNDLPERKKITWMVTALVDDAEKRKACMQAMSDADIDVRPFFVPLSQMDIYKKFVFSAKNSVAVSACAFNLPTSHIVGDAEVNRVVNAIKPIIL